MPCTHSGEILIADKFTFPCLFLIILAVYSETMEPHDPAEPEHVRYSLERRLCGTDRKDISQPGGGTTAFQAYMTRSLVEHFMPPDYEVPGISGWRSPVFFPSLKLCALSPVKPL